MEGSIPALLKKREGDVMGEPIITSTFYLDQYQTTRVTLTLYNDGIQVEMGDKYWIGFDFDTKFTLLRQPPRPVTPQRNKEAATAPAMKLGDPLGFKFQRLPADGSIDFFNKQEKEKLLEWRDQLAKRINQRGFKDYIRTIRRIGKGNSATVYLAEKTETKKNVAIKAFAKQALTAELKGKESLINEIKVMRNFDHPSLMKLFQVFESDNSYYLIIQHLDGGQLFDRLNNRSFKNQQIQEILRRLVNGLSEMHKKRIIHRDIKPENLIFRSNGSNDIVIADFGLATYADAQQYIFVRCGTPGYVAPEILNCRNKNGQEPISDIFSLGVIAHILAVKRSPFPGREFNEVLTANRQCNFNFQLEVYKSVDPRLMDLICKMMEVDPKKRIKTDEILQHQFFNTIFEDEQMQSQAEEGVVSLYKDSKKRKQFVKCQDSIGTFVVGRANPIRGTDSVYDSMNSTGSAHSMPSTPQTIKQSMFAKRSREMNVEKSPFQTEANKGSEPRKKFNGNQERVAIDQLRESKAVGVPPAPVSRFASARVNINALLGTTHQEPANLTGLSNFLKKPPVQPIIVAEPEKSHEAPVGSPLTAPEKQKENGGTTVPYQPQKSVENPKTE